MPVSTQVIALGYLGIGALCLSVLHGPLKNLDKPGSVPFLFAIFAVSLWPFAEGINLFFDDQILSMAFFNVRMFAAIGVSIGWFLVAYEYAFHRLPPRRHLAVFGAYLFVIQAFIWSNPIHGLVLGPETTVEQGLLDPDFGPLFWVQTVGNYLFIVAGTAIFLSERMRAHGRQRFQATLLVFAVVPPAIANIVTITGVSPIRYDLAPVGLLGSLLVLGYALYWMDLFDVVPIGREVAIEQMHDGVVTVNGDGHVVDCNETAKQLFDIDTYYGMPATALFERIGIDLEETDPGSLDTEIELTVDGDDRTFAITTSTITNPTTDQGYVVVCSDITELKQREAAIARREQDLEVLRQVQSRVLRHNIRNAMTVIQGHATNLSDDPTDPDRRAIISACSELVDISEKTREFDHILSEQVDTTAFEVGSVVADVVERFDERYPHASIELVGDGDVRVEGVPSADIAIENVLENAFEHAGPAASVVVELGTDTAYATISISDDGPGIPHDEIEVLRRGEETQLRHGSGFGLWLVKLVMDRSGGDVQFDIGDDGTTVELRFPRVEDAVE